LGVTKVESLTKYDKNYHQYLMGYFNNFSHNARSNLSFNRNFSFVEM